MKFPRSGFILSVLLIAVIALAFLSLRLLRASVTNDAQGFIRTHLNLTATQCPTLTQKITFWNDLIGAKLPYNVAFDADENGTVNMRDAILLSTAMVGVTQTCDSNTQPLTQCEDGIDNDGDRGVDTIGTMDITTKVNGIPTNWSYGDAYGNENNYVKFLGTHQGMYYFLRIGIRGTSTLQAVDFTSGSSIAELLLPTGNQTAEGTLFFHYPIFTKLDAQHNVLYLGFQGGTASQQPNRLFKIELSPSMRLAGTFSLPSDKWLFKVSWPTAQTYNSPFPLRSLYPLQLNAEGSQIFLSAENYLSTAFKVITIETNGMTAIVETPPPVKDGPGSGFVRQLFMDQERNRLLVVNDHAQIIEYNPTTLVFLRSVNVAPIDFLMEVSAYDEKSGLMLLTAKLPLGTGWQTKAFLFDITSFSKVSETTLFAGPPVSYLGTMWNYLDCRQILAFDPEAGKAYISALYNNSKESSPIFVNELDVSQTSVTLKNSFSSFPKALSYYDRTTHVAYADLPQSNMFRSINLLSGTTSNKSRSQILNGRSDFFGMRSTETTGVFEISAPHTVTQQPSTYIYDHILDPPILVNIGDLQCATALDSSELF